MAFWGISKSYNRPVLYIKKASNIYTTIAFIKSATTPLLSFSFLLLVFLSLDEVQIAHLASFADVVADTHGVQWTDRAGSSRWRWVRCHSPGKTSTLGNSCLQRAQVFNYQRRIKVRSLLLLISQLRAVLCYVFRQCCCQLPKFSETAKMLQKVDVYRADANYI